jgi:hypothetical protein
VPQGGPFSPLAANIYLNEVRFRVLVSLVHVRGGTPEIIAKINRFADSAGGLARRRNSYVHDTWSVEETVSCARR